MCDDNIAKCNRAARRERGKISNIAHALLTLRLHAIIAFNCLFSPSILIDFPPLDMSFIADSFVEDTDCEDVAQNDDATPNGFNVSDAFDNTLEFENRIRGLKCELLEANQQKMALEDQNDELKRSLDALNAEVRTEREKWHARLRRDQEEKTELSKAFDASSLRAKQLEAEVRQKQQRIVQLEALLAESDRQIGQLDSRVHALLQMDTSSMTMYTPDDATDQQFCRREIDHTSPLHLSTRLSADAGEHSGNSTGGESLFHEIYEATKQSEFNSKLAELEDRLNAADDDNYQLRTQLMDANRQLVDLKDELDTSRNEITALRNQIAAQARNASTLRNGTHNQATQTCFNGHGRLATSAMLDSATNNASKSTDKRVYASIGVGTDNLNINEPTATVAAANSTIEIVAPACPNDRSTTRTTLCVIMLIVCLLLCVAVAVLKHTRRHSINSIVEHVLLALEPLLTKQYTRRVAV